MWYEQERKRFSNEIHDTVLQELIILKRKVELSRKEEHIEQMKNNLFELEKDILDIVHTLNEIGYDLYPPLLSELGLHQSLKKSVRNIQLRTNVNIDINLLVDHEFTTISRDIDLALYRFAQELLINAFKHSEASSLTMKITQDDDEATLKYIDNGIGMDTERLFKNNNQIGIMGIKGRVRNLNGNIKIESELNKGFQMIIRIPIL